MTQCLPLHELFQNSADSMFIFSQDGFFDCNDATLRMFGYTKEALLKLHPAEISPDLQPDGTPSKDKADALIKKTRDTIISNFAPGYPRKSG